MGLQIKLILEVTSASAQTNCYKSSSLNALSEALIPKDVDTLEIVQQYAARFSGGFRGAREL